MIPWLYGSMLGNNIKFTTCLSLYNSLVHCSHSPPCSLFECAQILIKILFKVLRDSLEVYCIWALKHICNCIYMSCSLLYLSDVVTTCMFTLMEQHLQYLNSTYGCPSFSSEVILFCSCSSLTLWQESPSMCVHVRVDVCVYSFSSFFFFLQLLTHMSLYRVHFFKTHRSL